MQEILGKESPPEPGYPRRRNSARSAFGGRARPSSPRGYESAQRVLQELCNRPCRHAVLRNWSRVGYVLQLVCQDGESDVSATRIKERTANCISGTPSEIFMRPDFSSIGSYFQIGKVLKALMRDGELVRIGYGVYAKARKSSLTGRPVPRVPLESLAQEALSKLGVPVQLGRAAREYNAGSTQVPAHVVYETGSRRISRRLCLGREEVMYERNGRPFVRADR
jgi:hypothetical protein